MADIERETSIWLCSLRFNEFSFRALDAALIYFSLKDR